MGYKWYMVHDQIVNKFTFCDRKITIFFAIFETFPVNFAYSFETIICNILKICMLDIALLIS
jgi:hypothetical protein